MQQRIYIADDDPSVREVLSTFLRHSGYRPESFPGGKELIDACRRDAPDLVVLDIRMPQMDGFSVCTALRLDHPHLPVLLISSADDLGGQTRRRAAGGTDFLKKPFSLTALEERIQALLAQSWDGTERP